MPNTDQLEAKLEKITDRLTSIDITLAKQSVILDEHVKRTNLLEDDMVKRDEAMEKRLKPVQEHVGLVNGAVKILAGLSFLTTLILSILKLMKLL